MAERKTYKGFKPEWEVVPPPEKSFRSILKWGDPGEFKEPNEGLFKLMKKTFHLTDDSFREKTLPGLEAAQVQAAAAWVREETSGREVV